MIEQPNISGDRAAELAEQIRRIRIWLSGPAGQIVAPAIPIIQGGVRAYAPTADPAVVGAILMGVAATAAHLPEAPLAMVMNLIAAAGADLMQDGAS